MSPKNRQMSGQTLIETIIAVFVLATGLSAGLALAIYAFGGSTDVADRIVATALAREGVEAIRMMRDTNWLRDNLPACNDIGGGQKCHRDWLIEAFDIRGSATGVDYRVDFNPYTGGNNKWFLSTNVPYQLNLDNNGAYTHTSGGTPTNMFRKISIVYASQSAPYSANSPLVLVRSSVWWYGKRCNNTLTNLTSPSQTVCKVITEEYLTNWKNY